MSPTRINVLHLVLSARAGGRRNAIVSLAHELRNSIGRCDLCCLDELGCEPGELANQFDSVFILSRRRSNHFSVAGRLRILCRDRDIDLIHTHDAASQFIAALVRLARPQTKFIMTFHRSLSFESARRRDRIRNAFASLLSGAVVTASKERWNHYLRENSVSKRKLYVIPLGIDPRAFCRDPKKRSAIRDSLHLKPESLLIGVVGHYGPEKGIDIAIGAFNEFCRRKPELDIWLVVLGEGTSEQRSRLRQSIGPYAEGRVILAGYQTNVRDWYSAFDLFLHTPRLEAFGLVVIEAMAASLPVVATRVGGVPELVRHEETGLLCEPGSLAASADALARLIQSSDIRERYGANAVEVARSEYSISLTAERYLALYTRIVPGAITHPQAAVE